MNGGKDIKFGDDKRPVSIIPNSQEDIYNISNAEILTDEFGSPLITEVDTYFLPDASKKRSTSVVFPESSGTFTNLSEVSVASTTATFSISNTNNVGIATTGFNYTLAVGDLVIGPSVPDATIISRIGIGSIYISNFATNATAKTEGILIKRKSQVRAKSNPIWKIAEQFKETSEVSTTLLGVSRAETQLSLFANVSSYGLDPDEFEFYSYNVGTPSFTSWDNRRNEIYGNRYDATNTEEIQESAIKLSAFPVPYTFPFGPKFAKLGYYNATLFNRYINFIQLGNDLYDYYSTGPGSGHPADWKNKFLPKSVTYVSAGDVVYSAGISESFAKIDTWTDTWRDIKDSLLIDPVSGTKFDFPRISQLFGPIYDSSNTRPGYSSSNANFAALQSRRVFRYQPGRISGFTFGLRSSVEPSTGITREWGIANSTDQYVFRIDAGQFSIVRRSTIPLERSVLTRNGLTSADQTYIGSGDPYDSKAYYTISIPSIKFNGDPLNSNGKSGYLLQPEKVTMYKIEFGWYGAIGARFYAYIPTDNGDARWVVIHTLVIENSLGAPCLQDPYFRFKYSLNIANTGDARTPQYLYKYGASYYIDGGDEGSSQIYSAASKQKRILSNSYKSLLGIYPKGYLLNRNGVNIQNKKLIIPTDLNVSTDSLTEVKIVTCTACPGFGHVYTPGIATTESGRLVNMVFTDPKTISASSGSYFYQSDIGANLIAPSIFDASISNVSDPVGTAGSYLTASLSSKITRDIGGATVYDYVAGIVTTIPINSSYPYPVRLSNYNAYAASDFPFTGSKIEIQFLNTGPSDSYGHVADYLIGFTDRQPDVSLPNTLNGFIVGTATTVLPNSSILFGERTRQTLNLNEDGVETGDGLNYEIFKIDDRIAGISGPGGGGCSLITLEVKNPTQINNVNEFNYRPNSGSTTPDPLGRRWIQIQGTFPQIDFDGGQVTVLNTGGSVNVTNSKYVGVTTSYTVAGGTIFSYIQISQTLGSVGSNFTVLIRPVQITSSGISKSKLFNYSPYPLYLVAKLKDNASINNITIKETIGDFQRTITPKWYVNSNTTITDAGGNADITGAAPTNFKEINAQSSALVDIQNEQKLRPYVERDTMYIGANSTNTIDLRKIFGIDRRVITPDNNNLEATFLIAKKIDSGASGTIEASINFGEQ
jgi:hypothetical protein